MQEQDLRIKLNSKNGSLTFAFFMAGYILFSLFGQLIVGAIFGIRTTEYKVICSSFSSICIFGVLLFYIFYGKHKVPDVTNTKKFTWWYSLLAILLSAGMFLGLGFVNESVAKIFSSIGLNFHGIVLVMPTVWHLLAYTVTYALLPAVFEEVLFRGILLNCFNGMKRVCSVLICSLLFALYHQSFVQFLYQFIYGIALSYLALSAKSIVPSIIAHFANNFTILLLTFLQAYVNLFSPIIIVIGANALALFGTAIFFIQRKREKVQEIKGEVKSFFLPFGILGIVLCLAVAVGNIVV